MDLIDEPRVVVLAICSRFEPHWSNAQTQRRTAAWSSGEGRAFLLLGGGLGAVKEEPAQVLVTPVVDEFDRILDKTVEGIRWLLKNIDFDYVLRTNTSTYISMPLLTQRLNKAPTSGFLEGAIHTWLNPARQGEQVTYVEGYGLLMSRDVAETVAEQAPERWRGVPDDVAISIALQESGVAVTAVQHPRLTQFDPLRASYLTRVKHVRDPRHTQARILELERLYASTNAQDIDRLLRQFDRRERWRALVDLPPRPDRMSRLWRIQHSTLVSRRGGFVQALAQGGKWEGPNL